MSAMHNSSVIEVWKTQRYEQEKSIRLKLIRFPQQPSQSSVNDKKDSTLIMESHSILPQGFKPALHPSLSLFLSL